MKYFSNKRYLKLLHKIGLTVDDRVCMTSLLYVVYKTSFLCESVWLLYVNPYIKELPSRGAPLYMG